MGKNPSVVCLSDDWEQWKKKSNSRVFPARSTIFFDALSDRLEKENQITSESVLTFSKALIWAFSQQ